MADSLSRWPFSNIMSLMKDTMLHKFKGCYKDEVFLSDPFKSLSKEARIREEVDEFSAYGLDADMLYYKSRSCIHELEDHKKNIIYDCCNMPISSHPGFQKT